MDSSIASKKEKILSWVLVIVVILGIGFLANHYKSQIKKFFGLATVYEYDSFGTNAQSHGWTISTSSSAWGESIGWIDFAPAQGATLVADNALWGYAYGESVGWISLNCANADNSCTNPYKISNDGSGHLSGYAYGENVGWIDFGTSTIAGRPYGVNISSTTGAFSGYAYGEKVGWVNFSNGNVHTSWRPSVARVCVGPDGHGGTTTLANGSSTTYYSSSTVPSGTSCNSVTNSESRACVDSVLSGSFTHLSCTVAGVNDCIGPDTSGIPNGTSKTYYFTSSVRSPLSCVSQSRTCTNGVLSGSYANENCSVISTYKHSGTKTSQDATNTIPFDVGLIQDISSTTTDNGKVTASTSSSTTPGIKILPPIHTVVLPVFIPEKVIYPDLPVFGGTSSGTSTNKSFSFTASISLFLFTPLPDAITNILNKSPELKKYLALYGFSRAQDIVTIGRDPIPLSVSQGSSTLPIGLYNVNMGTSTIKTFITIDAHYNLVELTRVSPRKNITVSLIPIDKKDLSGKWNEKMISFTLNNGLAKFDLVSPSVPGRYTLNSQTSLVPLVIDVIAPPTQPTIQVKPSSWWSTILGWFGR